jgi:hypothetical protein
VGATLTYAATHAALRRARGSAVGLPCFRCGRRSSGWACTASAADRVTGRNSEGRAVTFSLDLTQYAAACDACRAATDREHAAERTAAAGLALTPLRKRPDAPRRQTLAAPISQPPALFDMP